MPEPNSSGGRAEVVTRCPKGGHLVASSTSPGAGVASYVGTLFSINATEAGPKDPLAEDQFEICESCELNLFF